MPIAVASGLAVLVWLTLAACAHSSPGRGCAGAHRCREKTARSSELTVCCSSAKRSGPWAGERDGSHTQVPAAGTARDITPRHGAPTFHAASGAERAIEVLGLRAGSGEAGAALPALLILPAG